MKEREVIPPGKPIHGSWMAFSRDDTDKYVIERFVKKHGYEPKRIIECGPTLMVGPIGKENKHD